MSDRSTPQTPEISVLVSVFTDLRRGEGLKLDRLAGNRALPLLHLSAVAEHAARTETQPTQAAVEIVRDRVGRMDRTDRVIADAVLGLGLFATEYAANGVPSRIVHNLEWADLGIRRATLLSHWPMLHQALNGPDPAEVPVAPRDRILRGRTEEEVFERLAVRLLDDVGSDTATAVIDVLPSTASPTRKVIVIGGATIDHIWHVERPPDLETSTIAARYNRSPGGKGLSQAVAVARLGYEVSLIATVGSDAEGQQILEHLELEGVDRSLVKCVPNSSTPATGIFERPLGESAAAVWRGALDLDSLHIDRHAKALADAAAILLTFEVSPAILRRALDLAVGRSDVHPLIVVTPGQPYPDAELPRDALHQIDYLVARPWELERFARSREARYDPEQISQDLLRQGLKALCLLGARGGTVYLPSGDTMDIPATPSMVKESSITRDAFCACLATALIERRPLIEAVHWSAAAMAAVSDDYLKSPSPPPRSRVDTMYRKHFS
ncbi:PfkB family carbohydrate kinase [Kribbella jiaozuonensis]|uniref:Carbohydrate kinase PfkB domain-containing protein n=1 Tax=Kribbella jiaozuonensis TaxID=2575441 RepID=A0A4U3LVD1_9ACTN|nr:PfkB family carbohydrate kinase [Kribbella jiaozuonensis]TKK79840.1 hypothetical protein FDA38_15845 [Kribbella jiaozuonensis]